MRTKLSLEKMAPHQWMFVHPAEIEFYDEALWQAIDLLEAGQLKKAASKLEGIIKKCPDFIDAYHHLALIYDAQNRHNKALALWEEAVNLAKSAFPAKFQIEKDKLEWGWLENRPFLRAYDGLALAYYHRDEVEKAVKIFEHLLSLNPTDNQGVRAVIVDAYLYLDQPEKILAVCKNYLHDMLPDTMYGKVLAFLRLGKKQQAKTALIHAYEDLPRVAEELAKSRHTRPKGEKDGYVTVGGKDQAFEYWEGTKKFWKETPGAIDFVKEFLAEAEKK